MFKNIFKILLVFSVLSCSKTAEEDILKKSYDDIFFYLSTSDVINSKDELILINSKKVINKNDDIIYELKYRGKKQRDSLWLIHFYNESTESEFLYVKLSTKLKKNMDSINQINIQRKNYPLLKRWKWVSEK